MKLLIDAFGGDNAPLAPLQGAVHAKSELGADIVVVGPRAEIVACARQNNLDLDGIEIIDAPRVFSMEMEPTSIVKENNDTSLAIGLKALSAGDVDAFVSAGSTGALVVGATLFVKRIHGVRRAAIGAILPTPNGPFLLLDAGANAECTAEMLEHFAVLGSIYAQNVLGIASPSVGLANIGSEPTKGDPLRVETYARLRENKNIRFTGNVEARDIPKGDVNVVVADGFTGNVILKLFEGVASALMGMIKGIFKKNPITILGALCVSGGLKGLKKQMDYSEHGGAPLLGINGVVIKAHGSSDAKAFFNAARQAKRCVEGDLAENIRTALQRQK
ncbi:MAG: phosphate acyltransferase PlsX [Oscillospiraceae bacterium]|nr:phosphate acyltransferase PlsX [Oscillospiraceae bacterium]